MQKNQIFITILVLLSVLKVSDLSAQDIHFSQFGKSPLHVNPAYTGMFEGNWRFSNNYRNQWSSVGIPFKTISAGFDKPFNFVAGTLGAGVYFVNDQSGAAALTANKVYLSLSWHTQIAGHDLSGGLQAGYVVNTFDHDPLTFPGQYNPNTGLFDSEMPSYLDTWDENVNYPDINLGVAWSGTYGKITPVAGLSLYHINNPSLSFLRDDDAKLPLRYAVSAYADIELTEQWFARPDLYTGFTTKASNFLFGAVAGYEFPLEDLLEKIYAGGGVRTQLHSTDALIFKAGVGVMGFDVGISYDVNISGLRQASNFKGAFELSIVYTNFVKDIERFAIPCDRY
ncbi:MAG: PorP/SprF family type IX secretion system membrane protein [Bacteroidota bacterium]